MLVLAPRYCLRGDGDWTDYDAEMFAANFNGWEGPILGDSGTSANVGANPRKYAELYLVMRGGVYGALPRDVVRACL